MMRIGCDKPVSNAFIVKLKEYLQQKQNSYCPIDNIQRIKLVIG